MQYTLKINGKAYPARFTVRVAIRAAERRGGTISAMFGNKNQAEFTEDMTWLASEMIRAGALLEEREGGKTLENLPTMEELMDSVDFTDMKKLELDMLGIINNDKPSLRAEGDEKNAEATSGA
ncbi:MAG: hypothetical protein IKO68_11095 [Oscillospiraceae bacterium]|jgi:hypothetical protein|nr:hypothetical protein [Oscillospiraceae bacterium]MBR4657079.1 hypothetical protein [Oscillospiraceae bacterium]